MVEGRQCGLFKVGGPPRRKRGDRYIERAREASRPPRVLSAAELEPAEDHQGEGGGGARPVASPGACAVGLASKIAWTGQLARGRRKDRRRREDERKVGRKGVAEEKEI